MNLTFDSVHDLFGIINLRVVRPCAPSYQSQSPRSQYRVQERILHPDGRAKPDWSWKAKRGKGRFESVDFAGKSVWSEPPEAEFWMALCMVADCMTCLQDPVRQIGIFCGLCSDKEECGASPVFIQESKNMGRGLRVGTIIDCQPDCFGRC